MKLITYSRNWEQNGTRHFEFIGGRKWLRRFRGRAFEAATGLRWEDVREYCGPRAQFWLSGVFRLMNVSDEEGIPDFGLRGLRKVEMEAVVKHSERLGFVMLGPPEPPFGCEWPPRDGGADAYNLSEIVRALTQIWDKPKGAKVTGLELIAAPPF